MAEHSTVPVGMPPRLHNVISYAGAALAMFVLFILKDSPATARLPTALWVFHFARRTVESLFVHRYSGRPVPPSDFLVEYLYYWGFATWIGGAITADRFAVSSLMAWPAVTLFLLGELGNARSHWLLRQLRPAQGPSQRHIPRGFAFRWVSCPHYLFEITSWLAFALLCQTLAAWVFLALGSAILAVYARQRHARYQTEFDGAEGRALYPSGRRCLVPFVF